MRTIIRAGALAAVVTASTLTLVPSAGAEEAPEGDGSRCGAAIAEAISSGILPGTHPCAGPSDPADEPEGPAFACQSDGGSADGPTCPSDEGEQPGSPAPTDAPPTTAGAPVAAAAAPEEDLDCADVAPNTPVGPDDPHGLDADGDGIGCEDDEAPSVTEGPAPSVAPSTTAGDGGTLPETGSETSVPLAVGSALLALGGASVLAARRLRRGRTAA